MHGQVLTGGLAEGPREGEGLNANSVWGEMVGWYEMLTRLQSFSV